MRLNSEASDRLRKLGGESLVAKMRELFTQNVRQRLTEIEEGIESGDRNQVERGFHSIRSSAGNVGAEHLMELAEAAENNTGELDIERLQEYHKKIQDEFSAVLEQLKQNE